MDDGRSVAGRYPGCCVDILLGPPAATVPGSGWIALEAAPADALARAVGTYCAGEDVTQAACGSAHFADLGDVDLASARLVALVPDLNPGNWTV